jgi:hypothetical protein
LHSSRKILSTKVAHGDSMGVDFVLFLCINQSICNRRVALTGIQIEGMVKDLFDWHKEIVETFLVVQMKQPMLFFPNDVQDVLEFIFQFKFLMTSIN